MLADDGDGFVCVCDADRDIDVLGVDERSFKREHRLAHLFNQTWPEPPDKDERRALEMPDLK